MTTVLEQPKLELKDSFTSTGEKFFFHEEAMRGLRTGQARCVTTHIMPTDICQDTCAFCSVLTREGNVLKLSDMAAYLDILIPFGLKSVIISGGGNPILYRCPETKVGFNELVEMISSRGLEIGLITNGMKLKDYYKEFPRLNNGRTCSGCGNDADSCTDACRAYVKKSQRTSWLTVTPETLDKLKWIRISMSGLDHPRNMVEVPDVDPLKTTLGFSWVLHDYYICPTEPNHGKVSTVADLIRFGGDVRQKPMFGVDRLPVVTEQIRHYVKTYSPRYVRLLPNCLEPSHIPERCVQLQKMADAIDPSVVFVQSKPPAAPNKCYLGLIHPVLNSDGYVYPCDSVVLQEEAVHKFANPWRISHWKDIAQIYEEPVRSMIEDPGKICQGCVFTGSNLLLERVVNHSVDITPHGVIPEHVNFV